MHELQIAQNIVKITEDEVRKSGLTQNVAAINLKIGKMHAVIHESLRFSFDVLKRERTQLEQAELVISEMPVKIRCRNCHKMQLITEPIFVCSDCSSTDIEIISGNELYIDSIEFKD
jgi:hydrogenase nickel incorporation protein HypA/HybF